MRYEQCGAPFDRWMLDLSIGLLTDLADSESARVLLHGDFHHHNILAASREPWLAIDQLPVIGILPTMRCSICCCVRVISLIWRQSGSR